MVQLSNQKRLKPWMGVILFVVGLLFLIFAGSYMQLNWGMVGLVTTELGFLAIAVLYCVIFRVSLKEVFPIKKVTGKDILGLIFMFMGSFLLSLVCVGFSSLVVPTANESMEALTEFLYGNTSMYVLLFLIAAVLPAICEEAFMRGSVLSSFRSLKHDWVICLIIGLMFGILHLDPLRFLNTACLGAILAWIMTKKNNFILPVLMHLINNTVSTLAGFISVKAMGGSDMVMAAQEAASVTSPLTNLGTYLIMGFSFPILLVLGAMFLDREHHKAKRFLVAGIISGVLFASGICLTLISTATKGGLMGDSLLTWNSSYVVTEENVNGKNLAEAGIDIDEEGIHMIVVSSTAMGGEITFIMEDENGEKIISKTSKSLLVVSEAKTLEPGHYLLYFTGGEDVVGKTFTYEVIVK
jgi:membrane protease YdiL (CAAX protease family)